MTSLIFIGIGIAIFLTSLLISKKDKKSFDIILVIWLMISALQLAFFYWSIESDLSHIPQTILFPAALLPYLSAPILFFYVNALITERPFHLKHYWWHLSPYFIVLFSFYYVLFFNPTTEVYVENAVIFIDGKLPLQIKHHGWTMALVYVVYPIWSLVLLFRHRKKIAHEFSYHETITINWLRYLILFEIIFFLISFSIIWVIQLDYIQLQFGFKIISITQAVYIFLTGYFGVKQEGIFLQYPTNYKPRVKYTKSNLQKNEVEILAMQLKVYIQTHKPYLEPRLSIDQLASQLSIKKHKLSQLLNDHLKVNFYDYINQYRVQEFKNRLKSRKDSHLSLLGLALECGFNSKSSFNAVFKKFEKQTPSQYQKSLSE